MSIFIFILTNNIAPIFLIIFLGFILGKTFKMDVKGLSKISFYLLIPSFIFVSLYETTIDMNLLKVLLFAFLFFVLSYIVSSLVGKLRKQTKSINATFINTVILFNAGNFGVPLIALVFKDSPQLVYATSIQIMILAFQNIITYTVGFLNGGRGQMKINDTLKKVVSMPSIYAIFLAFLLKYLQIDISKFFLWPSLIYLRNGLVPMALITLGVQLSITKFHLSSFDIYLASFMRLCGGPIITFVLITLMGFNGIIPKVLLISSAVPSAVNSALIAVEFDNEPDFASQVVITTTLLSSISLTIVIYLAKFMF
ncbi:AEC family transporter [Clostridium sediminicola]|uniref:AEC family transporter n=1 Tax=Clostridium sediminicola TaxID=3114879 RepID=UPI0031F261E8